MLGEHNAKVNARLNDSHPHGKCGIPLNLPKIIKYSFF
jgi:hypothetical protein